MKILVTGAAGFIGFNFTRLLLNKTLKVVGIDNLNNYYSVQLKIDRLKELKKFNNFKFYKINLKDKTKLHKVFNSHKFDAVFHLAAQAGVRHSVDYPREYIDSNINGFFNILESCLCMALRKYWSNETSLPRKNDVLYKSVL